MGRNARNTGSARKARNAKKAKNAGNAGNTGSAGNRVDLALLGLRLGAGGVLFTHGAQKLFGWFGGSGLEKTSAAMEGMGFRPGKASAFAAGAGEAGGGALLALGLATPAAGAAAAGVMAGAVSVHAPQGFVGSGGYEYPAFLGFSAAAVGLAGPGRFSLDRLTCHSLNRPWAVALSFVGTAAAVAAVVGVRARGQPSDGGTEPPPSSTD